MIVPTFPTPYLSVHFVLDIMASDHPVVADCNGDLYRIERITFYDTVQGLGNTMNELIMYPLQDTQHFTTNDRMCAVIAQRINYLYYIEVVQVEMENGTIEMQGGIIQ